MDFIQDDQLLWNYSQQEYKNNFNSESYLIYRGGYV